MKQAQFLVMLSPIWVVVGDMENSARQYTEAMYARYRRTHEDDIQFMRQNADSIMDTEMGHYMRFESGNYLTKGPPP